MQAHSIGRRYAIGLIAVLGCCPTAAFAELKPAEIAILANAARPQSLEVARYYAARRGIPDTNICSLDLPTQAVLPRTTWNQQVRPAIRQWLADTSRQPPIRCWVTTWGVPMKIGKADPEDTAVADLVQLLEGEKRRRWQLVVQLEQALTKIAPDENRPAPEETRHQSLEEAKAAFQRAVAAAQDRVTGVVDAQQRQIASQQLQEVVVAGTGMIAMERALVRGMAAHPDAGLQPQLLSLQGRIQGLSEARALIESTPLDLRHHSLSMAILGQTHGVFDTIAWINGRLQKATANETDASFDNELACVLWPDYRLLLWQPNYLHARYDGSPLRSIFPTLMVSRLDAPTFSLCRAIIDQTLETEARGLRGVFYLDGRGVVQDDQRAAVPGTPEEYDQSLAETARLFREDERLRTVYQNQPELFQPGECPDAALYCGWYSVARYVDAFNWQPGAVGYHIASYELRRLHHPDSNEWCKRMIENGVCATVGAVQEPYLQSFPQPHAFFPLLREGQLTLVECFYRTTPYTSWAVTLIGDPLYRPFKN